MAEVYVNLTIALKNIAKISLAGYVQISDVEQECDGLLSYDRTPKFDPAYGDFDIACSSSRTRHAPRRTAPPASLDSMTHPYMSM